MTHDRLAEIKESRPNMDHVTKSGREAALEYITVARLDWLIQEVEQNRKRIAELEERLRFATGKPVVTPWRIGEYTFY